MICPNCNTKNDDDANLCKCCGFRLRSNLGGKNIDYFEEIPEREFWDLDFEEDGYVEPAKKTREIKPKFVEKGEFDYINEGYDKEEKENKKFQSLDKSINKSTNKSKKIIPVVIVLLCIVFVIGFFKIRDFFYDTASNKNTYEENSDVDSQESEISEDYTQDDIYENNSMTKFTDDQFENFYESGTPIDVLYVDSSCTQKYLNYNFPISFNIYHANGFSFGYPSNFYNSAEELEYGYKFSADNGSFLYITVTPCSIATEDLLEEMDRMYKEYESKLCEPNTIAYKYGNNLGYTRFILTGYEGPNKDTSNYIFCNVKNDKIEFYHLRNTIGGYTKKEKNHARYILDSVYRLCSFSGTIYLPRTYTQLMKNEMGEIK